MKKQIPQFLALTFILLLSACHNDWNDCEPPLGTEERFVHTFPDIQELIVDCSIDVDVFTSNNPRVVIHASPNIAAKVELITQGPRLFIDQIECIRNRDIEIDVYTPGLFRVVTEGSADITFKDYNDVETAQILTKGSGDIYYMGDSRVIECVIDGSGDMELVGKTDDLFIEIDGSGDVYAFDMATEYTEIEVDGSGDCEVWVRDQLRVDIDGSGDVYFIGYPDLHIHGRGSGDVIDAN